MVATTAAVVMIPVVAAEGITKRFGATLALDDVSIAVQRGEIHALAGENGAGKSTLIRIIAGVSTPDSGRLLLDGEACRLAHARDALRAGIATIHQELSLVGPMSICDNLHLGVDGSPFDVVRRAERRARTRSWLARVGLDVAPETTMTALSLADRQRVEIARALRDKPRLLVLDEPTSALSYNEAEHLLRLLEQLREEGCAMLYVSHHFAEQQRLAQHLSVLRDGRLVHHGPMANTSATDVAALMSGDGPRGNPKRRERVSSTVPTSTVPTSTVPTSTVRGPRAILRASGFRLHEKNHASTTGVTDLEVDSGEIVGLAGLHGCGASSWLHAMLGLGSARLARLEVDGVPLAPSPQRAVSAGLLLLTGDRGLSVLSDMSVIDNATLSSLRRWSRFQWLRPRPMREAVTRIGAMVQLRAPSLKAPCSALSGGNQQKVALMRCMLCQPKVLLLDDATRGIDSSAKQQVHRQLRALAAATTAIVMVSSDTAELVQLCDRVLVMVQGRVTTTLSGEAMTRGAIVTHASRLASHQGMRA